MFALGVMESEKVSCSHCGDRILKSEAALIGGKYYCSHCLRNYVAERTSEANVFFGCALACFLSSFLSLSRGLIVLSSSVPVLTLNRDFGPVFAVYSISGILSLLIAAMFFISGLFLVNARDVRGKNYGLLTARTDFVIMVLYLILLILLQVAGYIPDSSLSLIYVVAMTAEYFCDGILMLILPTLSDTEFAKGK